MNGLHKVEAFIILDHSGKRVFAKYFPASFEAGAAPSDAAAAAKLPKAPWPTIQSQLDFEKVIKNKVVPVDGEPQSVTTAEGDIMLVEGHIVIFHRDTELIYFTVGPSYENELVLSTVQSTIIDSLHQLLNVQNTIDKRTLLENFFLLTLVLDEVLDDGMILELSVSSVVQEVQPFTVVENQAADGAKKAFKTFNKYLKQNNF